MVSGAPKGFDLWSYLMFPGEFAGSGTLERMGLWDAGGGGSQELVARTDGP